MNKDKALDLALEALESCDQVYGSEGSYQYFSQAKIDKAIVAIKQALAAPVQEPVAWISHNAGLYHFKPDESLDPLPLYLDPPAAQPCPTCEALARTVMMDQTGRDA
jgi:hypothetical protein